MSIIFPSASTASIPRSSRTVPGRVDISLYRGSPVVAICTTCAGLTALRGRALSSALRSLTGYSSSTIRRKWRRHFSS